MGKPGTRPGKHILCAACRKSAAAYNFAYTHGLPRPKRLACKACRRVRYHRYGESVYQRMYKRRVRKAKAA